MEMCVLPACTPVRHTHTNHINATRLSKAKHRDPSKCALFFSMRASI
jgi:hypothetical protein